jgi:hypothetical protein
MSTHKNFFHGAAFALFVSAGLLVNASATDFTVSVTQTGTGETRDGALVDACRLAVAQIHGSRIAGGLLKTNEKPSTPSGAGVGTNNGIINQVGSSNGGGNQSPTFSETRDNTTLTFGGLLTAYKVTREAKGPNGGRWSVEIKGDVLKAIPDRFAGRLAVVVASTSKIKSQLGDAVDTSELAARINKQIEDEFSNNSHFVLLEREMEDIADDELARAAGGNAAVREGAKLSSEKAADVVVIFESQPISFQSGATKFKLVDNITNTKASLSGTLKIIDVATKGEIGRATLEAKSKACLSRDADEAKAAALVDLGEKIDRAVKIAGSSLMCSLDMSRIRVTEGGGFEILSPRFGELPEGFSSLRLFKNGAGENSKMILLGDFVIESSSMEFSSGWETHGIKAGDVLSYSYSNTPVPNPNN